MYTGINSLAPSRLQNRSIFPFVYTRRKIRVYGTVFSSWQHLTPVLLNLLYVLTRKYSPVLITLNITYYCKVLDVYACVCTNICMNVIHKPPAWSWETGSHHLVKKFPASHKTRRSINVLTSAHNRFLSWTIWIQFTHSQPVLLTFISLEFSHLRQGPRNGFFPLRFSDKQLLRISHHLHAWCMFPAHIIFLDFSTVVIA
jgi:hypothetical protein